MPKMIYLPDGTGWPVFGDDREVLARIIREYLGHDAEQAFYSAVEFDPDVDCQDCMLERDLKNAKHEIQALKRSLSDAYDEIRRIAAADAAQNAKTPRSDPSAPDETL